MGSSIMGQETMFGNKNWKKHTVFLIVIGISTYALFLRLSGLGHRELWSDELFQLSLMKGGILQLIKAIPYSEQSSYLNLDYFLAYPFFKVFSFNKWGVMMPHIIATILGFYLLYLICRRYFKTVWGYIITFGVVCFNATLMFHATEMRPYAVLPTLALGCLYFSEVLVNENNLSSIKKFLIGAFFLLTICFHTYGLFMLFFSLVYALLNKPPTRTISSIYRSISKMLIVVFSIGLPFWLFCIFGPLRYQVESHKIDAFYYIPNPLINAIGFLKGVFGNLIGFKKLYFLLIALVFPFVFPVKERSKQISFFVIMVFSPMLSILACDLLVSYYFIQRQFIWVIPYFAIFLGWSCDSFMDYIFKK